MVVFVIEHGGGRTHIRTRRWSWSYQDMEVVVVMLGHGGGRCQIRTQRWS